MKKNHPFHQTILQRLLTQPEGSVALSVMTVAEIARGLENIKTQGSNEILHKAFESIIS